jgi:hypothetical protein
MDDGERSNLTFENIEVGMRVIDQDDHIGTIKECEDIHNILVEYENGGSGFYCLDEKCEEYDELYEYGLI